MSTARYIAPAALAAWVFLAPEASEGEPAAPSGSGSPSATGAPSVPRVTISPARPEESQFRDQYGSFRLTATATSTDPEGDPVSYAYRWLKNGEEIPGATASELPASAMGSQGHTVRGYTFGVEVTASDGQGHQSVGHASVTIGGPVLGRGMNGALFANFWRYYAANGLANPSIPALKAHSGADWVSIDFMYFQSSPTSTVIYEKTSLVQDENSTLAEADLVSQIHAAHRAGLKVLLYPEIWIDGLTPGPRDSIEGSEEWFAAYRAKVERLADVAQSAGADALCVGVELWRTHDKESRWRQLIQSVRQRYSGLLTYSSQYYAGMGYVDGIDWWDALDLIGVSCNFDLRTGPGTVGGHPDMTVPELLPWYASYRDAIREVSVRFGKPVLVTEVITPSVDGACQWNVAAPSTTPDWQEQADFFEAVFETFDGEAWVKGIVVGQWPVAYESWYHLDPIHARNVAYLGKNAERVIRSWLAPPPVDFYALTPCRLIDTREPDGPSGGPALPAMASRAFVVAGRCGIPPTAKALSINVTTTAPTRPGRLKLYPGGTPAPDASSVLSYAAGQTQANNAIVSLGTSGDLAVRCEQASGTAHVIVDVSGYFE